MEIRAGKRTIKTEIQTANGGNYSPLLTGKVQSQLIYLAVPLLMGNILQQCYNIVDCLLIGRFLGMDAFAAAGVAGTVMNLLIFILDGFCTGLSVLFSMFYGAGDREKFRREVVTAMVFGSLLALGLGGLFFFSLESLLRLIQTPEALCTYAKNYLRIIAAGALITWFYNLFSGILRSLGDTRASLYCLAAAVGINVVLDGLFLAGFGMGIQGAAIATILSQFCAAAGCYVYLCKKYGELLPFERFHQKKSAEAGRRRRLRFSLWDESGREYVELIGKTIRFGFSSALQGSSLYIGKLLVQGSVNLLGTVGIAAYTAATRLEGFANSFGDSGALAMSVMISQNYGAGNHERIREILKKGIKLHVILGILLPSVLYVTAPWGIRIFLGAGEAQALSEGIAYLRMVSIFYVLCFIGSALVGFFRGIGKLQVPVIGTTLNISIRVILSWLLIRRWHLKGLGLITGIGWMAVVSYQIVNLWVLHRQKKQKAGKRFL